MPNDNQRQLNLKSASTYAPPSLAPLIIIYYYYSKQ